MKFEIICWNTKDKIKFDNIGGTFRDASNSIKDTYKDEKLYYHLGDNIMKIIKTDIDECNFYNNYLKKQHCSNNKIVIILNEINIENFKAIKHAILNKHDSITVIAGRVNLEKQIIDTNHDVLRKVINLPQLMITEEDTIEIKSILFMIMSMHNNQFDDNIFSESCAIIGNECGKNVLGDIPLFILKKFNYVYKMKNFILNLYCNAELDMKELSYIEDPLREYIEEDAMLTIKQSINNENYDGIYFSIMAK